MNFFQEHLPGCTPLNPCKNCETVNFLRSRLSQEDMATLYEMAQNGAPSSNSKEYQQELLNTPVAELFGPDAELGSVRLRNCLVSENIRVLGDLLKKSEDEVRRIPNLGRKSLNIIREVLEGKGLKLSKMM